MTKTVTYREMLESMHMQLKNGIPTNDIIELIDKYNTIKNDEKIKLKKMVERISLIVYGVISTILFFFK